MLTITEQFFIESIKKGDKKAFEFLFNKYYSDLWKYATNLVKDNAYAEDLVMDVFVRFWEEGPRLNIKTSLSNYLYRSVHNHCLNYLTRKHKRFPGLNQVIIEQLDSLISLKDSNDPFEGICCSELSKQIDAGINQLPEECRKIFIMSRIEDTPYKDIATRLGISENTVKVQIFRALKKLYKILGDYRSGSVGL